jgi:DNA-binding beta-propeller fold protein YncE
MKYKSMKSFLERLVLIVTLAALPTTALADSPWRWQMSLMVEQTGDSMYMPSAVAFDKQSERYYVVDTGRSRLISFGQDGKFIRAFTANNQLKSPFDMVRLDNGQLWVVEKGRNSLTLIDVAAKKIEHHTLKDGERLVFPDRIAVAGGKLYVLNRSNGQVLRLAADLSIEQRFDCKECSAGFADFIINGDKVVALEPRDKKIFSFNADGTLSEEIKLDEKAEFPVSLGIGPSGYYYVLDRHQNSVLAYDESGQFAYRFLAEGHRQDNVFFPRQLRFDPWGRLCVVDEGNGRVEIFSR